MKIYEGNILTCDTANSVYKYLIEDNGKIVFVGNELPVMFSSMDKIELGEKALIPAFADSHIHFTSVATFHAGLNLSAAVNLFIHRSLQENRLPFNLDTSDHNSI